MTIKYQYFRLLYLFKVSVDNKDGSDNDNHHENDNNNIIHVIMIIIVMIIITLYLCSYN